MVFPPDPGWTFYSEAVAGNRLYAFLVEDSPLASRIEAYDLSTGRLLWRTPPRLITTFWDPTWL